MVRAVTAVRDGPTDEDKNCGDRVGVHLDPSGKIMEPVLLNVGESGCIEDADLEKRLYIYTNYSKCAGTYHYAVPASKLIKADSLGQALVFRTTLLVSKDVEVVVIDVVADKDIGDELDE